MSNRAWLMVGLASILVTTLLSGCGGGGDGGGGSTGTVQGQVVWLNPSQAQNTPLGGVTVTLVGGTVISVQTGSDGTFVITGVPVGTYSVTVADIPERGFVVPPGTEIDDISVFVGDTVNIPSIIVMDPNDLPPDPV